MKGPNAVGGNNAGLDALTFDTCKMDWTVVHAVEVI